MVFISYSPSVLILIGIFSLTKFPSFNKIFHLYADGVKTIEGRCAVGDYKRYNTFSSFLKLNDIFSYVSCVIMKDITVVERSLTMNFILFMLISLSAYKWMNVFQIPNSKDTLPCRKVNSQTYVSQMNHLSP